MFNVYLQVGQTTGETVPTTAEEIIRTAKLAKFEGWYIIDADTAEILADRNNGKLYIASCVFNAVMAK